MVVVILEPAGDVGRTDRTHLGDIPERFVRDGKECAVVDESWV
jgi:hypothetical protein